MAGKHLSRREFSIPEDELEQHRIQLEHNLQNTDLSLHLSSVPDDDAGGIESLEYPRHDSAPEHFPVFASFDRHSRDIMDLDVSHIQAWSIHDDEGINPYDVRTMSTAAHHASAVTVTAGLGRGGRREPSISGAEYDPDRPLQDIISACHGGSDVDETDRSQDISRPKLSETLHRVGFSPRRPRGGQSRGSQRVSHETAERHVPPSRRHVSQPAIPPHVNVHPPTPSASGSRFTKMARGLTRDVRQAQEDQQEENARASAAKKSNRSRRHLPDVTGITNAVVSPAKVNLERYGIRGLGSKEVEGRLMASLNTLHTRLNHLETENSIARRRVRELELELEVCKHDLAKERTRVIEDGAKGKERRQRDVEDPHASKYFEVAEEKKALEALITTLRSHLTRVTSDLSSQQQILEELRRLRESDALSLTEKAQEINQLRTEVERLAGEIEVLRGVVEEGLHERRQGRDVSSSEPMERQEDEPDSSQHSVRRFIDDEEVDRISGDLDERRSERASNSSARSLPASLPEEAEEATRPHRRAPDQQRMQRLFSSVPRHGATSCRMCKGHRHIHGNLAAPRDEHEAINGRDDKDEGFDEGIEQRPQPDRPTEADDVGRAYTIEEILERMDKNGGTLKPGDVPPQTVLGRVIGELEDEFIHFRGVYSNLAEEYKSLDCATQVAKRRVVGGRLRDVIEVMERKGNQITSLYDLLAFKDKSLE